MPLLLLLVLGGVAWAATAGRTAGGKSRRPELEKFASSCPLDPGLPPDAVQALRVQFASAIGGSLPPDALYRSGDELERAGFPQAGACAKQLAVALSQR